MGNSQDKLRHSRSVAYSVELFCCYPEMSNETLRHQCWNVLGPKCLRSEVSIHCATPTMKGLFISAAVNSYLISCKLLAAFFARRTRKTLSSSVACEQPIHTRPTHPVTTRNLHGELQPCVAPYTLVFRVQVDEFVVEIQVQTLQTRACTHWCKTHRLHFFNGEVYFQRMKYLEKTTNNGNET